MKRVPTVSQLWVYPIKSCRGIPMQGVTVGDWGIAYDREWMIVDERGMFVSQRTHPMMAQSICQMEKIITLKTASMRNSLVLTGCGN